MSLRRVYLDFNATTPLVEPCKKSMIDAMSLFGNPSSIHSEGRRARAMVEKSREVIGSFLDLEPENIIFTSGAKQKCSRNHLSSSFDIFWAENGKNTDWGNLA